MRWMHRFLCLALAISTSAMCEASRPVTVASHGCVVGGRLYSIYDARTVYRYTLTRPVDLRPYEGKRVWLEGSLLPGDRFTPRARRFRVIGVVGPALRALIVRDDALHDTPSGAPASSGGAVCPGNTVAWPHVAPTRRTAHVAAGTSLAP